MSTTNEKLVKAIEAAGDPTPVGEEVAAIGAAADALSPLDVNAQRRALSYLADRFPSYPRPDDLNVMKLATDVMAELARVQRAVTAHKAQATEPTEADQALYVALAVKP